MVQDRIERLPILLDAIASPGPPSQAMAGRGAYAIRALSPTTRGSYTQHCATTACAFTSCPRSAVVFATLAVLRATVVQTPTAHAIVAALPRDPVTMHCRS